MGPYHCFGLSYLKLFFSNCLFNLFSPTGEKSHVYWTVYLWRSLQSCKALKTYISRIRTYRKVVLCMWTNRAGTQEGDSRNEGCGKCARRVPLGEKAIICANCLVSIQYFCCCSFFSQLGIKKKKYMPYNHQHKYFFISEYLHSPAIPWGVQTGLVDLPFDL